MAAEKDAMTIAEFGERIGLKKDAAYGIVRRGEVKVINVGTVKRKRWRVTEKAYAQYLKSREREGHRGAA